MKNKLLGTSALIAVLTAAAAHVSADAGQAPTMSMSGNAKFQAYGFSNSKGVSANNTNNAVARPSYGYGQGYAFTQNGELDFVVAGVAANGLEYNYTLILTGDTSAQNAIQENRIEFKGNWGTFQAGDKVGPEDILMTDAANVLGATGGFDGDWNKVINETSGVFTGDSMMADTGTTTKVVYYTPRFSGFMLGAAFTPSSAHKGNAIINTNGATGGNGSVGSGYNNHGVSSGALNFSHEFTNGFGMSLTAAGINASSSKSNSGALAQKSLRTMSAWQLGGLFNYQGWQLGLGYLDNQKSGTMSNSVTTGSPLSGYNGGKAWSGALGYTFGDNKVAFGYQGTTQNNGKSGSTQYKGKADIYSVTADHTLAPGLGVYAEYDYLRMRIPNAALAQLANNQVINNVNSSTGNQTSSNNASVFILGTKISF